MLQPGRCEDKVVQMRGRHTREVWQGVAGLWKCWGTLQFQLSVGHVEILGYLAVSALSRYSVCCSLRVGLAHGPDLCPQLICKIRGKPGDCSVSRGRWSRSTPVSGSRKEGSETVRLSSLNRPLGKALRNCWELM